MNRVVPSLISSSFLFLASLPLCGAAEPPAPYGAVPTEHQVNWQRMEYYGFVHFGLNTYTDREWGYGDEDPKLFNPSDFDAAEIVKLFKDAGMKGMILTSKHHDGFCLWPTKTTGHNISKSPWKNGKGDLVKEFAQACKQQGIKFGTYISPWDRNNAEYGREGYLKVYYGQIKEMLSGQYGDIFEMWFDGANGGDGYYGGARETRKIPKGYYNFPKVIEMIRKMQPSCIIWGCGNIADGRWGGSEAGHVGYPHWATLSSQIEESPYAENGAHGVAHGDSWVPAEGDTSIRRGWFWHASANNTVKSPEQLLQVWLDCVGRGANFILNVPPDKQGRIYPADAESLMGFKKLRDRMYANDFALNAKGKASNIRGNDAKFGSDNLFDNDIESYWTTDDGNNTPSVEITLPRQATFDLVRMREQIRLGQRVDSFKVEAMINGNWQEIVDGKTIGNQVILPTKNGRVTTDKLRLTITECPAVPCISEFSLLLRPVAMPQPTLQRKGNAIVIPEKTTGTIRYTTDGTDPDEQSPEYKDGISLPEGGTVKARIYDHEGNHGPTGAANFGISKADWKIISTSAEGSKPELAIDDNPKTFWHTHQEQEQNPPQSFTVDMGDSYTVKGFSYLPRQDGTTHGMTDQYVLEVSLDNKNWSKVAEGEFSNLRANPVEQFVTFKNVDSKVRYFRFTGKRALDKKHVSAAEITLYTSMPK